MRCKAGRGSDNYRSYKRVTTVSDEYCATSYLADYPKELFRSGHPTQKPVALLEFLVRTYTAEGETVLDNTMGSGSTGVACINTGRRFIGIEREEGYFQTAETRIRKTRERLAEVE